jgi:hypothetical protein
VRAHSRVALALLQRAAQQGVRFSVIVTEGRPDETGLSMARALDEQHVPVTLVLDSGAAYILERCARSQHPWCKGMCFVVDGPCNDCLLVLLQCPECACNDILASPKVSAAYISLGITNARADTNLGILHTSQHKIDQPADWFPSGMPAVDAGAGSTWCWWALRVWWRTEASSTNWGPTSCLCAHTPMASPST